MAVIAYVIDVLIWGFFNNHPDHLPDKSAMIRVRLFFDKYHSARCGCVIFLELKLQLIPEIECRVFHNQKSIDFFSCLYFPVLWKRVPDASCGRRYPGNGVFTALQMA